MVVWWLVILAQERFNDDSHYFAVSAHVKIDTPPIHTTIDASMYPDYNTIGVYRTSFYSLSISLRGGASATRGLKIASDWLALFHLSSAHPTTSASFSDL